MINGLLVLLLFQCLGEAIKAYTAISLPGPVIGMLLLFISLCLFRHTPVFIANTSQRLIQHLSLLFMPPAVGLFFLGERFDSQWPAIIGALVLGTLLSLIVTTVLMKRLFIPPAEKPADPS